MRCATGQCVYDTLPPAPAPAPSPEPPWWWTWWTDATHIMVRARGRRGALLAYLGEWAALDRLSAPLVVRVGLVKGRTPFLH